MFLSSRYLFLNTSQWRHMSDMAYKVIGISIVCSTVRSGASNTNHQSIAIVFLYEENPLVTNKKFLHCGGDKMAETLPTTYSDWCSWVKIVVWRFSPIEIFSQWSTWYSMINQQLSRSGHGTNQAKSYYLYRWWLCLITQTYLTHPRWPKQSSVWP